ncbi:aminopeptidase P family protein [Candidatus Woesearchaeota archaeon]|nr:aminopeptidase P family protein [Candidatus Woesearchaeota archaeon]
MRLKEFQKQLAKKRMGLALFFNFDGDNLDPNLVYFSSYTGFGALAITPKKAMLFVPVAEYERAKRTSKVPVVAAEKRMFLTIKNKIRSKPKLIGIDKNRVTLNFYKALRKEFPARYSDISSECLRLRTVKIEEEIRIIKKACTITDEIIHNMFWRFKQFKTESEVAAFLVNEAGRRGLGVSFKPIVASGKNACEAHHEADSKKLRKGFCVVDFGVRYKGYCSDITRTIYLGKPTQKEIEMYYTVLNVQTKLIAKCQVGKSFIEIDKKAHELFGKKSAHFTHLIGHGIGTEIHENPNPKQTPRRPVTELLENSVITIEPGLYYPGKSGIRIEDDVLVTAQGPKVLTKTGKNLLIVSRSGK